MIRFVLIALFFLAPGVAEATLAPLVEYLAQVAGEHRESEPVPIFAIGGCPGVGKTYLAKNLVNSLEERGVRCALLPLDHFNLSPEERKKIGTEWDIRHFKPAELLDCLASISLGAKLVEKPTCNQLTGEIGKEILDLRQIDLLLFDGLYSLCSEPPLNFFDYCFAGVFLEADEVDIYKWKWEREQKKSIPRTKEQFARHMEALMEEFQRNIAGSRGNALFILKKDSTHYYETILSEKAA